MKISDFIGQIWVYSAGKGGTGKSSGVIEMSVCLAAAGYSTLAIDQDELANTTQVLTGGRFNVGNTDKTICDLYSNPKEDINNVIQPAVNAKTKEIIPNLFLIPSDPTFDNVQMNCLGRINREKILFNHLKRLDKQFDFILIDCPKGTGIATLNALYVADLTVLPLDGVFALTCVPIILDKLVEVKGVDDIEELKNQFVLYKNKHNATKKVVDKFLTEELGSNEFIKQHYSDIKIPVDENMEIARTVSMPFSLLYKSSKARLPLRDLTLEFIKRTTAR